MPALYLNQSRLSLTVRDGTLEVRREKALAGRYPLALLDHVVILASCQIDSRLILTLSAAGSAVSIVDPRTARAATLLESSSGPARRRVAQLGLQTDQEKRGNWARGLIAMKLRRQALCLRAAAAIRPAEAFHLMAAAGRISELRGRLGEAGTLAHVSGLEGAAAAAYFPAFGRLFAPSLQFTGRNRRPPRDPVNACLSLAYTLSTTEAALAARRAGLDPLLGFLHEPAPGRPSLACDLVEPLRPALDWQVFELFRSGRLRPEHFGRTGSACLLGKTGRTTFLEAYGEHHGRRLRMLTAMARAVARALAPDEDLGAPLELPEEHEEP